MSDQVRQFGLGRLDQQRRGRLVIGLVGVAIGVTYLVYSLSHYKLGTLSRPGAGMFPLIIGGGFVLVSCLLVFEAVFSNEGAGAVEWPTKERVKVVAGFALCMIGFVLLYKLVGQLIGSMVFMAVSMKVLGKRPWWQCLLWGVLLGGAFSAFFIYVLKANLPAGLLAPR